MTLTNTLLEYHNISLKIKYILKTSFLTPISLIYKQFNVNNLESQHTNYLLVPLYKHEYLVKIHNYKFNIGFQQKKINVKKIFDTYCCLKT